MHAAGGETAQRFRSYQSMWELFTLGPAKKKKKKEEFFPPKRCETACKEFAAGKLVVPRVHADPTCFIFICVNAAMQVSPFPRFSTGFIRCYVHFSDTRGPLSNAMAGFRFPGSSELLSSRCLILLF